MDTTSSKIKAAYQAGLIEVSKLFYLILKLLPVIVPIFLFLWSTMSNIINGLVYLAFLFSAIVLRFLVYVPLYNDRTAIFCGFGTYVLCFSMGYICFPMLINPDAVNPMVLSIFIIVISVYFYSKYTSVECGLNVESFLNCLVGTLYGVLIAYLMQIGGSSGYLYLNELSTRQYCSTPSTQTFKCSVYQGGQLLSEYAQQQPSTS